MTTPDAPTPDGNRVPAPMSMQRAQIWLLVRAAIIAALSAGCTIAVLTGWVSPARVVLALGFLLFCPGLALAEVLEVQDLAQRLALATGASIALSSLLSLALIYAGAFSIPLTVAIIAAVTLATLGAALVRRFFRPQHSQVHEPAR